MLLPNIDPLWCIVEDGYNSALNKHYEGACAQGSGYMSVRGCLEEGLEGAKQDEEYMRMPANVTLEKARHPKSKWGTYIPGIVGPHPLLKEEIINLPWFLEFRIWFDDEKLDMEKSRITEHKRWLDLNDGVLYRTLLWNPKKGCSLRVSFKRYISMEIKNLCVQEISIQGVSGQGKVYIESGIDARVRTNGYNHFENVSSTVIEDSYIVTEVLTNGGNRVVEASKVSFPDSTKWDIVKDDGRIYYRGSMCIEPGKELGFSKFSSAATDRDLDSILNPEERALRSIKYVQKNISKLFNDNETAWNEKWKYSDIKINGDDYAQLAVRFSLYHLMRSDVENDPRVAICAKGYAGEAYFGRSFWDTEMYLLPFFIYTNPKAAKNLLMFRYNTLKGARANARAYGYRGARYPWESSITGEEQCANWQYADNEVHISADISYGLWHYYMATDDYEFMRDYAIDIMAETSRYWTERVDKNRNGGYDLLGVMGPDEYSAFTRNNAYTNRMVKFNLQKTLELLKIIRDRNTKDYEAVISRLGLNGDELALFKEIGEKLPIPEDEKRNLVLQSEDFDTFADIDFDKVWKDRSQPFGHFVSQERMYRSKCLKQADALMMMYLFPDDFTMEQEACAYEYYEPMTTHDSSLSSIIHSIIANRIGRYNVSRQFFKRSIDIDLNIKKGGAAEGIHIANCGGVWQCLVFGFAGVESALWSKNLKIAPHLPEGWDSMEFTMLWHGTRHYIKIEGGTVSVK